MSASAQPAPFCCDPPQELLTGPAVNAHLQRCDSGRTQTSSHALRGNGESRRLSDFSWLVAGELIWGADDWRYEAMSLADFLHTTHDGCVGNMAAVPGQKEIHFINSGGGNMSGIFGSFGRNGRFLENSRSEFLHPVSRVQIWNSFQQQHSPPRHQRLPFGDLVSCESRSKQHIASPLLPPPAA